MGIWQRIKKKVKEWVSGGKEEKKTPPKTRAANNSARGKVTASTAQGGGRVLIDIDDKKQEKRVSDSFKAKKAEYKDIGEAGKKKTPPEDPKIAAAKASRERLDERKAKLDAERKSFNKATGHKYDTEYGSKEDRARARQRLKSGEYQNDPKAAKWEYETHPVSSMAARTAANAVAFGVPDAAMSKLVKRSSKEMQEAEALYRKNQEEHPYVRAAAEFGGSLVGFGGTARATEALGAKAVKRFAPKAAEDLAENAIVKGLAKRSVNKAVKKGVVNEATEELIKQVGKDRATKIVNALGNDIVQNLTTGAIYDVANATKDHDVLSPEWFKEIGRSAAFNAVVTGGVAGASALSGGKKMAVNAAETLAKKRTATELAEALTKNDSVEEAAKENLRRRLKASTIEAKGSPSRLKDAVQDATRNADEVAETLVRNTDEAAESLARNTDNIAEQAAKESASIRNEELHHYLNDEIVPYREKVQAFDKRLEEISAELDDAHRIAGDVNLSEEERLAASQRYDELMEESRQLNDDIAIAREQAGDTADAVEAAIRNNQEGAPTRTVNDEIRESLSPDEQAAWTKAGEREAFSAEEAEEVKGMNWRTNERHTKQGATTLGVGMGDKKYRGAMEEAIDNGDMTIEVYHDKENYAKGAQRVLDYAEGIGGADGDRNLKDLAKYFEDYANGKQKVSSKEARDMLYDILAAVDYANGMEDKELAEKLFLSATKAGAELTSVSGLSLRQWHKIAMSSPDYRSKAVKQQIELMFNQSRGFRKKFGTVKGTLKKAGEDNVENFAKVGDGLEQFIKDNPKETAGLDKALKTLENAKSKEEVEQAASEVLVEARKVMPVTAFDQLTQWRYVAMLSSPTTHIKNIVGNIYSGTLGQLSGAISSSIEDGIIKKAAKGKKGYENINADDYLKSAKGLSWGARNDAKVGVGAGIRLNDLKEKLKEAQRTLKNTDDMGKALEAQKRVADLEEKIAKAQKNFDETSAKIKSVTGSKAQELFHTKSRESLITDAEKWEMHNSGATGKAIGKASEFLGMALETSDAVAVERIYRETADKVLRANDYEKWVKLAAGEGDAAKAAKARVKQLEEYASQHAAYKAALDTYRNYNAVASWMNKTIKNTLYNADAKWYKKVGGFALHAVMPFTKVPTNIVKRSIDYSPAGLIQGKKMLTKAIESGDYAEINKAVERLSEGLIGTGIAGLGMAFGALDPDGMHITTRLDRDDPRDKAKKDRGYMDYSVRFGNKDFTLEWATPTASTFFVGVECGRMLRNLCDKIASGNGLEFKPYEALDAFGEIVTRGIEPALQLTMFQGVNSILEDSMESRYDEANIHPLAKASESIASNYIQSMFPSVLGRLSRAFAPYDYYISGDTSAEYRKNLMLSKIPIASEKLFDAKTDAWGNPKNAPKTAGEKAFKVGTTLFSPMNVSNVTWDETDDALYNLADKTGKDDFLPKVYYDSQNKGLTLGRSKDSAVHIDMSNKDAAQYNLARGKAGEDAMAAALESVIFNRYYKDDSGHYTIEGEDNYTPEMKEKKIAEFKDKGVKDVVAWIIEQPAYKQASPSEQRQIIRNVVGNGDTSSSVGAKRTSELTVAKRHGMSEDEYNYKNEVPERAQKALDAAIATGKITYKQAVDFARGAGKTYYRTDENGEGGSVSTYYNKKEMMEYLQGAGYSYEEAETLYNAYKSATSKKFSGIDTSSGRGGYRRRYGGYRRRGGGGGSKKAPAIKKSAFKASKQTYKSMASSLKPRSSSSSTKVSSVKVEPPKVKFKKYEV